MRIRIVALAHGVPSGSLSAFGTPRYIDKVYRLIRVASDGSFELDMDYFSFHHSTEETFNRKFETLFGSPRDPRANFFTPTSGYPLYLRGLWRAVLSARSVARRTPASHRPM